jgi:CheY-like chemotaxis protein
VPRQAVVVLRACLLFLEAALAKSFLQDINEVSYRVLGVRLAAGRLAFSLVARALPLGRASALSADALFFVGASFFTVVFFVGTLFDFENVSTEQGRDQVSRRAARLQPLIHGARVIVVNDVPSEMKGVIDLLKDLGIVVKVVTTTQEALITIDRGSYDVIVSDMLRGTTADEGLRFLKMLRQNGNVTPTIFTVGRYEPERGTPPYAFGITNRIDELLNLLFTFLKEFVTDCHPFQANRNLIVLRTGR